MGDVIDKGPEHFALVAGQPVSVEEIFRRVDPARLMSVVILGEDIDGDFCIWSSHRMPDAYMMLDAAKARMRSATGLGE